MAIIPLLVLLFNSCSTKRNTAWTRFYHGTTAHYNYYFNANQEFRFATIEATQSVRFDYTQPLPFSLAGNHAAASQCAAAMESVVARCASAMQLHSITVKPDPPSKNKEFQALREYNPWVRRAALLMGKAKLWYGDVEEAKSALEFALTQYENTPEAWQASLWLAQLELINGKPKDALARIQNLKRQKNRPKKREIDFYLDAIEADALTATGQLPEAYKKGLAAYKRAKSLQDRMRCNMALAQLEERLGKEKQAATRYKKVARRSNSYDMAFNAKVRAIALGDQSNSERSLEKLARDEKNVEYLDQIYYSLGEIALRKGDTAAGMQRFLEAARASVNNPEQKGIAYLRVAEWEYSHDNYIASAGLYDSALSTLPDTYPGYNAIRNRQGALSTLARHDRTVRIEDSLQRMAKLPEATRVARIDSHIARLKLREQKKQEEAEEAARNRNLAIQNSYRNPTPQTSSGGQWYFSNPQTLALGRNEFRLKWGDRKLEDNWRRKNKNAAFNGEEGEGEQGVDSTRVTDSMKREFYLQDIPLTDSLFELSEQRMARAYNGMAEVYRGPIPSTEQALATYDNLAKRLPNRQEDAAQALYSAYRLATDSSLTNQAANYRSQLLRQYPQSTYALMLSDPIYVAKLRDLNDSLENLYASASTALQNDRRGQANRIANQALSMLPTNREHALKGPFTLLAALSAGSAPGSPEQLNALEGVASNSKFPNEAQYAQEVLNAAKRRALEATQQPDSTIAISTQPTLPRVASTGVGRFNLDTGEHLVALVIADSVKFAEAQFQIIDWGASYNADLLVKVSEMPYVEGFKILRISGFDNHDIAADFANAYRATAPKQAIPNPIILVISPKNCDQLPKGSIDDYQTFYKQAYLNNKPKQQ